MADNQGPQGYVPPQTGYVLNDAADGTIFIGSDENVKGIERPRQIELHSTSNACLKLFKDGGFEIQSQPTATLKDNIYSHSKLGLAIKANPSDPKGGITIDAGNGEITLSARSIRFQSTGNNEDFVINSKGNLKLESNDTVRIDGSVVAIGARTRMALYTKGSLTIGGGSVRISEPKLSLTPQGLLNFTTSLFTNLFPDYFP
jgi:hypothetical protein